ncbi:DUF3137 domain-containing protein [Candidatus Nomurabacteria bacterium]|nr:DUF3137 domain-containing protein [Candidatus Kaiserbacteria bacterium]MCB9813829.1 DUF3137 domain-containing protein [Candidatus Nomurabacteria bacterium]
MKTIKERIPDIKTLESLLDGVIESSLTDFLQSTHARREEVIVNFKLTLLSLFFSIAILIGLSFLEGSHKDTMVEKILTGSSAVWLTVVLLSGRQWLTKSKLLAREMNMALVPIFTNTLDRMMMYTNDSEHRDDIKSLLEESSLMTIEEKYQIFSDDTYTIYADTDILVRELMVIKVEKNRDGKLDSNTVIFKGVLVSTTLNRSNEAEIYISTEGDKRGFAHQSFWSRLTGLSEVKETILEWNDFEKDLHVATTNPTAAREILTPEFMQDLHAWWSEHKLNIRIAFKGNKMYMLLPEESIKIDSTTTSTKLPAIKRYAWSLLRPIWRSLVLIEDVSK